MTDTSPIPSPGVFFAAPNPGTYSWQSAVVWFPGFDTLGTKIACKQPNSGVSPPRQSLKIQIQIRVSPIIV